MAQSSEASTERYMATEAVWRVSLKGFSAASMKKAFIEAFVPERCRRYIVYARHIVLALPRYIYDLRTDGSPHRQWRRPESVCKVTNCSMLSHGSIGEVGLGSDILFSWYSDHLRLCTTLSNFLMRSSGEFTCRWKCCSTCVVATPHGGKSRGRLGYICSSHTIHHKSSVNAPVILKTYLNR